MSKLIRLLSIFTFLIIIFLCNTESVFSAQLDFTNSVSSPVWRRMRTDVVVRSLSGPAVINATGLSGYITFTSGLPYLAEGAYAIWYNPSGSCPPDGSVYDNSYQPILDKYPGSTNIFFSNTYLVKPGTVTVPLDTTFGTKYPMSGCYFATFDITQAYNRTPASTGTTLESHVFLEYDTDTSPNPNAPKPYNWQLGNEFCFGESASTGICAGVTRSRGPNQAFMTVISTPNSLLLWGLYGSVVSGPIYPFIPIPTGDWSANVDFYIYKGNSCLKSYINGPSDYFSQIPSNAFPILSVPIQSNNDNSVHIPVSKVFNPPLLIPPGSCIVSLTNTSSGNGGFAVFGGVQGLLQLKPDPIGSLDTADCSVLGGWAGDQSESSKFVEVDLYSDGIGIEHFVDKISASSVTTKAVCDVLGSTEFPCNHGFVLNVPDSLKDGKPHTIDAYAINGTTNPKLPGSGKIITCTVPNPTPNNSNIVGNFDNATCSSFVGWVGNKATPTTPTEVHFYTDGIGPTHLVDSTVANTLREKAVCDAIGSIEDPCNHGFIFTVPASLKDGKPHIIDAYAINGSDNPKLTGSGKTITCSATKPGDLNADGKVDLFDYNILVSKFGNPYTIFDYNTLVSNYGK